MRRLRAALAVTLVEVLAAACSASIPRAGAPGQAPSFREPDVRAEIAPVKMLKLQLAGKVPTALHRAVLKHILAEVERRGRPVIRFHGGAVVGQWVSGGYFGYIFGQNKKGNATVTAIDTVANGCYYNYGLKVDHSRNLWTSCYNNAIAEGGAVQEYSPGSGTPAKTYNDESDCGSGCAFYGFANDVATDSTKHVFAANEFSESCSTRGCTYYTGPISWWPAGSPSSSATAIADSGLENAYYLDTDRSGNLYVDGYACTTPSVCGYVVDEVKNPASGSPQIVHLITPNNTYVQGLYVSNGGTLLNVVEPDARKIARYPLPFSKRKKPTFLGPTVADYAGFGSPIDGGFDLGDTRITIGDAWGWLDSGKVAQNEWSGVVGINVNEDNLSAQLVPSDK